MEICKNGNNDQITWFYAGSWYGGKMGEVINTLLKLEKNTVPFVLMFWA
jgi:hypothetical protein